jgi:hypothetical protein
MVVSLNLLNRSTEIFDCIFSIQVSRQPIVFAFVLDFRFQMCAKSVNPAVVEVVVVVVAVVLTGCQETNAVTDALFITSLIVMGEGGATY